MEAAYEETRRSVGSSRHHKHKQKKDKHKHKDKSKRREAVERTKEVGSDVESGEILGDGAAEVCTEPEAHRAVRQPQQLHGEKCTDVSAVHRAAGESPAAAFIQRELPR